VVKSQDEDNAQSSGTCSYCGTALWPDTEPGYEAAPGIVLCDECWNNHDPKHPYPKWFTTKVAEVALGLSILVPGMGPLDGEYLIYALRQGAIDGTWTPDRSMGVDEMYKYLARVFSGG
jgi:hypothetical protein